MCLCAKYYSLIEKFGGGNTDIMPKDSKRIVIKYTLGKLLGTINFSMENNDDDDILNGSLSLPPLLFLKHMMQVSVRKSFALDIDLGVVAGKLSQEKLAYVRKIFSGVNGFGGASTPLKFGGIIWTSFTSEKTIMAAAKLANDYGVVVNTNLKHSGNNHMNRAIVLKEIPVKTSVKAVCTAVSKFGVIKIQLDAQDSFRALLYTLLIGTTAYDFYSCAYCATVCFDSKSDLVGIMTATPVIKGVGLCWSYFSQTLCTVCKDFGHMSLSCQSVKGAVAPGGRKAPFLAQDQFRLARIYTKKSAPISCPLTFSGKTWVLVVGASSVHTSHGAGMSLGSNKIGEPLPLVVDNLESHLVSIENSLVSLMEQIKEDIVIEVNSGKATNDKIDLIVNLTASPHVVKLKKMLNGVTRRN
ncbi:hypothetical protein G9A89_012285 [Geosiphon pyriformis]|nr:hypothetical protein G9A89_012285 [Geosiphon pyriformis]